MTTTETTEPLLIYRPAHRESHLAAKEAVIRPYAEEVITRWNKMQLGPFPYADFSSVLNNSEKEINRAVLARAEEQGLNPAGPFQLTDAQLLDRLTPQGKETFVAAVNRLWETIRPDPASRLVFDTYTITAGNLTIDPTAWQAAVEQTDVLATTPAELELWSEAQELAASLKRFSDYRTRLVGPLSDPAIKELLNPVQTFISLREVANRKAAQA